MKTNVIIFFAAVVVHSRVFHVNLKKLTYCCYYSFITLDIFFGRAENKFDVFTFVRKHEQINYTNRNSKTDLNPEHVV